MALACAWLRILSEHVQSPQTRLPLGEATDTIRCAPTAQASSTPTTITVDARVVRHLEPGTHRPTDLAIHSIIHASVLPRWIMAYRFHRCARNGLIRRPLWQVGYDALIDPACVVARLGPARSAPRVR